MWTVSKNKSHTYLRLVVNVLNVQQNWTNFASQSLWHKPVNSNSLHDESYTVLSKLCQGTNTAVSSPPLSLFNNLYVSEGDRSLAVVVLL